MGIKREREKRENEEREEAEKDFPETRRKIARRRGEWKRRAKDRLFICFSVNIDGR